jgi:hypothetical protein
MVSCRRAGPGDTGERHMRDPLCEEVASIS